MSALRMVTVLACITALGANACDSGAPDAAPAMFGAALANHGTIFIETGATFPGAPILVVHDVTDAVTVSMRLVGAAHFAGDKTVVSVVATTDGPLGVPAIIGGAAGQESTLTFDIPGVATLPPVVVLSTASASTPALIGSLTDDSGIILVGPDYAIIDQALIHPISDTGTFAGEGKQDGKKRICLCPFNFNVGKLELEASCRGNIALWLLPEDGSAAFTPAKAETKYKVDGFKFGEQLFKVDGSTCNYMSCSGGTYTIQTCMGSIASLLWKSAPYPVNNGTFGNEPPAGAAAQTVK